MSEQQLQKKIMDYLESRGAWVCKTITCNKRGVPDILACVDGVFVAIEVKSKGKLSTVSPIQQYQLADINASGGVAVAVDSLEAVKEIFVDSTIMH